MTGHTQAKPLLELAQAARAAGRVVAAAPTAPKDAALEAMAARLDASVEPLLEANARDLEAGRDKGLSEALLDRLRLTPERVAGMSAALRELVQLPDPVGEIGELRARPNGLQVGRMRIPLGVILMIYEARPNVTAEAAGLCLKSGNAILLRGGSEAFHANAAIASLWREALAAAGLPPGTIQLVPTTERAAVDELLGLEEWIDLVIPRGGEGLIRAVAEKSRIPVIKHYKGVCHLYTDEGCDLEMAVELTVNGKVQRPSVCNSLETLLVHESVAQDFLPRAVTALRACGVEVRGCKRTRALVSDVVPAGEDDWREEYLDLVLAVRVVPDMDAAIEHITRYGSLHTETIVTESHTRAQEFLRRVNSSCVLVNASTRFNDGGQLGLGAEIGISTTKLHAFGPMGLRELTTQKFVVLGQGQTRG